MPLKVGQLALAGLLDKRCKDWPLGNALAFARLALRCRKGDRQDRPALAAQVLPELARLAA